MSAIDTTPTTDPARRSERPDPARVVTGRILDQLDHGTVPWQRPWSTTASDPIPRNLSTGKAYRGINAMLLWSSPYHTPWWITYRQAQQLGGQVKKGEHHTPIVVWKRTLRRLRTADALTRARAEGRKIVRHPKGGPACEIVFSRIFRVFNAEQTTGLDEHPALLPVPEPDWDPIAVCEDIVAGYPDPPTIETGGTRAFYDPGRDLVRMPDRGRFPNPTGWHAAVFHELAHSTGHPRRLHRPDLADAIARDSQAYAREELTAELAAAFLCAHARIDTSPQTGQHAAYIDGWRRRISDDPRLLITAAQRAQKAVDHILNRTASPDTEEED